MVYRDWLIKMANQKKLLTYISSLFIYIYLGAYQIMIILFFSPFITYIHTYVLIIVTPNLGFSATMY